MTASDRLWRAAAEELAPAKSLVRIDERARQVVTGVSLVGSVVTGLGLAASGQLEKAGWARWLALGAVCLAVLAVVSALGTLLLRFPRPVTPGNLDEVERFFRRQFTRAYGVVAAGVLLLAAVVLAGSAAVLVLAGGRGPAAAALSVTVSGVGGEARLAVRAEVPDVVAGGVVRAEVVGVSAAGGRVVAAHQVTVAGVTGVVTVVLDAVPVGGYVSVEVLVDSQGRRCTVLLQPAASDEVPAAVCAGW